MSIAVGITGLALLSAPLSDAEYVFMAMVQILFHPLVAGFLLAAILAAIMSTVDSQLLASSSALAEDLYPMLSGHQLSEKGRITAGRWAVAVIATVATGVAMDPDSKVLDVVAYAWGGLGATLGPVTLLSLHWPRMNWQGALAGVISGGVTVVVWKQLSGGIFEVYELVPAFFVSLAAILVTSMLTPAPEKMVKLGFLEMSQMLNKQE